MSADRGPLGRPGPSILLADIIRRIEAFGPLPFNVFMDLALYGERGGYYERGPAVIGPAGDFYTASDVSSAFGEMLADQIAEFGRLIEDGPFDLVELGAGKGTMAADILARLEERHTSFYQRVTYWIIDRSRGMRESQERLLRARMESGKVRWAIGPEATRTGGIVGCIVANEFYDALPVRIVRRAEDGTLVERRVGLEGGSSPRLGWIDVPIESVELRKYAETYGLARTEGAIAEAGLAAQVYAVRAARALRKGFQIVIDYGDRAGSLYDPALRPAGTLIAYSRHQTSDDPFERIGEQDLTAHVNFSALEDAGREEGLESLGFTTQDRFLIALGLADRIASLAASHEPADIRKRLSMMALIHPEVMGRSFRVLVQAKGAHAATITGLQDPFAGAIAMRQTSRTAEGTEDRDS